MTSVLPLLAAIHKAETPYSFFAFTSAPLSRAATMAFSSPARTAVQRESRASALGSAADAESSQPRQRITHRTRSRMGKTSPNGVWELNGECRDGVLAFGG